MGDADHIICFWGFAHGWHRMPAPASIIGPISRSTAVPTLSSPHQRPQYAACSLPLLTVRVFDTAACSAPDSARCAAVPAKSSASLPHLARLLSIARRALFAAPCSRCSRSDVFPRRQCVMLHVVLSFFSRNTPRTTPSVPSTLAALCALTGCWSAASPSSPSLSG